MDTVSDWDREYMKRLGRYKEESHRDAIAAHLERSPNDRLTVARRFCRDQRFWGGWKLREDDPAPFYEIAKRRGLYRP